MLRRVAQLHFLLTFIAGCADKAVPDYAKCVEFEASGKSREAEAACKAAISANPTSEAGKAAAERLKAMQPVLEKLAKEDADNAAVAAVARMEEQRKETAELRARIKRKYTMQEEDDVCASQGKPPKAYRYTGGTYAENQGIAYSDGCVAYDERSLAVAGHAQNHFCCPR